LHDKDIIDGIKMTSKCPNCGKNFDTVKGMRIHKANCIITIADKIEKNCRVMQKRMEKNSEDMQKRRSFEFL
jgi:hypothetical protein